MLGVTLSPEYLQRREQSEAELARSHKLRKRKGERENETDTWHGHTDSRSAYFAGDHEVLYSMECE